MKTYYLVALNGVPFRLYRDEEEAIQYQKRLRENPDNVVYVKPMVVN